MESIYNEYTEILELRICEDFVFNLKTRKKIEKNNWPYKAGFEPAIPTCEAGVLPFKLHNSYQLIDIVIYLNLALTLNPNINSYRFFKK